MHIEQLELNQLICEKTEQYLTHSEYSLFAL